MTLIADIERRFSGIARLYGHEALQRFQTSHVCVVGVGGVGSWAVEALARSGIGHLTLIDLDIICESNTNRQLPALDPYFGMAKVTALAERVHAINPQCQVTTIEDFVSEDTVETQLNNGYHFIIDAIDNLQVKVAIARWCISKHQPFIVSGGAGGQLDPCQIKVADLSRVTHDPLLAKLRYTLRRYHGFVRNPEKSMHIPCIYSTETLIYPQTLRCDKTHRDSPQGLSCSGFGASMTVTATFGMIAVAKTLASLTQPLKINRV